MLLYLCCASTVWAQNVCNIEFFGRVVDEHDETPLAYTTVALKDSGHTAVADSAGRFVVSGLCPGIYKLEIRHVGCEPVSQEVRLSTGRSREFIFHLEHHHELREVEVAAQASSQADDSNTTVIDGEELEKDRMKSLSESVEQIPGVAAIRSGPNISKPQIHGVSANRIAIYQRSIKLEDQQWGAEHAPALDLANSGSVAVVKGAEGVEYGPEAIGGAIVVRPPLFEENRPIGGSVRMGASTNGRGGIIGTNLSGALDKQNRLKYRLAAGWNKSGDRTSAKENLENTGNEHWSVSAGLQYQYKTFELTANQQFVDQQYGILRRSHTSNLTDLQNALTGNNGSLDDSFDYELVNPRQHVQHASTEVSAAIKPGAQSKLTLDYGYQFNQREEFDIRRGPYNSLPAVHLDLSTHSLALKYTQIIQKGLSVKLGAEGNWQENFSDPETGTRPIIPNFRRQEYAGFGMITWLPASWELKGGFRVDYSAVRAFKWYNSNVWETSYSSVFDEFVQGYNESGTQVFVEPALDYINLSGVLSAVYHWIENGHIGLQVSVSSRPPNSPELFSDGVHLGTATIEYGDLRLDTEQSYTGGLYGGFSNDQFEISLSGFFQYFDGYIQPEISGLELTVRGAFPRLDYTQNRAYFAGGQWKAHWEFIENWRVSHSGSMTHAEDLTRNAPLINIPPTDFLTSINWQNELKNGLNLKISAGVRSVMKKQYAPRVITPEELNTLSTDEISEQRALGTFDLAPTPGEFHLLQAEISMSIPWAAKKLLITIRGENLLNRAYRNYLNRFRYYADDTGVNVQFLLTLNF